MLRRDIFKALAACLLWPFRARPRVGVDAGEGEAVTTRAVIPCLTERTTYGFCRTFRLPYNKASAFANEALAMRRPECFPLPGWVAVLVSQRFLRLGDQTEVVIYYERQKSDSLLPQSNPDQG